MNTKIYFNSKYLEFMGPAVQQTQNQEFIHYNIHARENPDLKKIVKRFTDAQDNHNIQLSGSSLAELLPALKDHFYYIEAAGGFIEKNKNYLFIHRHGRWDLPKGKLEKDETVEKAAIRECEEECGIKNLRIERQLSSTFHIYPYKKGFALKQSYWFYMSSDYDQALLPQLEEDIDKVEWFTRAQIESTLLKDTYFTISDVVKEALKM